MVKRINSFEHVSYVRNITFRNTERSRSRLLEKELLNIMIYVYEYFIFEYCFVGDKNILQGNTRVVIYNDVLI